MEDRYTDFCDHAANDVRFSKRATVHDKWKEKTFEEGCGFVEGLFEGIVEVDVEFAGFLDVLLHAVE